AAARVDGHRGRRRRAALQPVAARRARAARSSHSLPGAHARSEAHSRCADRAKPRPGCAADPARFSRYAARSRRRDDDDVRRSLAGRVVTPWPAVRCARSDPHPAAPRVKKTSDSWNAPERAAPFMMTHTIHDPGGIVQRTCPARLIGFDVVDEAAPGSLAAVTGGRLPRRREAAWIV